MRQDDNDRLFDLRVVRRNVSAGRISKQDHERFIAALPDASENILDAEEGGDDDGFDGSPPPSAEPVEAAAPVAELPSDPFASPPVAPAPSATIGASDIPLAAPVAPAVAAPVAPAVAAPVAPAIAAPVSPSHVDPPAFAPAAPAVAPPTLSPPSVAGDEPPTDI